MNRPSFRYRAALVLLALTGALPTLGCMGALATAAYLIKGNDVDPDYAGFKNKTVAVVCRPLVSLQYRDAGVSRDLAQQISLLLSQRVKKIHVIEQQKVAKWTDENTWDEYTEVGKALKADMVVGVDLESFNIFEGQTLYQGKARAAVTVYDCKEDGQIVFQKTLPQSVYPPNTGIPASERQETEFRHEFVMVLADQIARHFYAHDAHADLAQDAAAAFRQ